MKFSYFFIVMVLLFNIMLLKGQVTFNDPIGGVTLMVPDTMSCTEKYVQTEAGEVFYKSCNLEILHKTHTVKFSYYLTVYPFNLFENDDIEWREEFFEETRQASAKAVLGDIVYYSNDDIKEYPGTVWRVAFDKGKGVIKSKAFVKADQFINIKVDYPILINLPEIDQYIQSLYIE